MSPHRIIREVSINSAGPSVDRRFSFSFDERAQGSHHLFRKPGITELINLQRESSKTKVYQVRQVRAVLLTYRLAGEGGED